MGTVPCQKSEFLCKSLTNPQRVLASELITLQIYNQIELYINLEKFANFDILLALSIYLFTDFLNSGIYLLLDYYVNSTENDNVRALV